MPDTVVITTQDLEPAVRLRDAFRDEDYAIELLTPGEKLSDVPDPCILILTGSLADKQSRRLLAEAADHGHLPVIGARGLRRRHAVQSAVAAPVLPLARDLAG